MVVLDFTKLFWKIGLRQRLIFKTDVMLMRMAKKFAIIVLQSLFGLFVS